MSKWNDLTDNLQKNKLAYTEQWKKEPTFDYVEVMNETLDRIVELLPFKNEEEKDRYLIMVQTFMDYDIFESETLRIGERLKGH